MALSEFRSKGQIPLIAAILIGVAAGLILDEVSERVGGNVPPNGRPDSAHEFVGLAAVGMALGSANSVTRGAGAAGVTLCVVDLVEAGTGKDIDVIDSLLALLKYLGKLGAVGTPAGHYYHPPYSNPPPFW